MIDIKDSLVLLDVFVVLYVGSYIHIHLGSPIQLVSPNFEIHVLVSYNQIEATTTKLTCSHGSLPYSQTQKHHMMPKGLIDQKR